MRAHSFAVVALLAFLGAPAAAQTGRLQGVVRDVSGQPIKGAVVRAMHPQAQPRELTSITDDNGRFAMIGLRSSTTWRLVITAAGYFDVETSTPIRVRIDPPLTVTMRRDPGPLPGALSKDIQDQLAAARAHRDAGRFDQAIAAYQSIHSRNARLTTVNLVLAEVYRAKARQEADAAARRALLEKAVAAYDALLQEDADHDRATKERAVTLTELTE